MDGEPEEERLHRCLGGPAAHSPQTQRRTLHHVGRLPDQIQRKTTFYTGFSILSQRQVSAASSKAGLDALPTCSLGRRPPRHVEHHRWHRHIDGIDKGARMPLKAA